SPQDHLDLAALYQKAAVEHRARAAAARKSLAAELRSLSSFPNKSGVEFPWVTKVKREAQAEISQAETAAAEAERSADYHRMRARELEGLEFATLAAVSSGGRR
ncbi:MAG: hypothetical protein ACREKB_16415, partial [Candidatus Rokuibacteriota bacterium]